MKSYLRSNAASVNRRLLAAILTVVLICISAMPVYAYTVKDVYKTNTLAAGTVAKGTQSKYTYDYKTDTETNTHYIYKITVPSNGYITFTNYMASDYCILGIFKTLAKAKKNDYSNAISASVNKTIRVPVSKGTYYVKAGSYNSKYKFKYTFKNVNINTTNYCRAKAASLASGKTATICAPLGYQYSRWYKVKLTAAKTLVVTFKDLVNSYIPDTPEFYLYNSAGERITVVHGSGYNYKSAKKIKAGTYYIKVFADSNYMNEGYLYTLQWK